MIFTANLGGYDVDVNDKRVYCYTEKDFADKRKGNPRELAKYIKVLDIYKADNPQLDKTLWIDANIKLLKPRSLIRLFKGCDLGLIKHPYRGDVSQEFQLIKSMKVLGSDQEEDYQDLLDCYPDRFIKSLGLLCGGVVYRNYREAPDGVNAFNSHWWGLIHDYGLRDQLTLPFAIKRVQPLIKVKILNINIYDNEYFKIMPHKK